MIAATPARPSGWTRAVEPAPVIYASGPTRTGKTWEMVLRNVEQVDYICRTAMGGLPEHARRGAYYWGCYHAKLDAVVLVDPRAWPSRREWDAAREHEWAHARGWRHRPDGHGTDWARSLPPAGPGAQALVLATTAGEEPPRAASGD
ncbi:hypothetical protein LJR219_002425 [Phenylobacterium sp. LjRoot219]|uniref:hypothetical protein n=1 Tax=Phenylobacterium sp. LjRoot219 TaxID=3342283 RepID=UPI003ED02331